jgi:phospholipase/carboxylesterase
MRRSACARAIPWATVALVVVALSGGCRAAASRATDPTVPAEASAPKVATGSPVDSGAGPDRTEPALFGSAGGVKLIETTTGGAASIDRTPLIVALHPQGGDPAEFLSFFRAFAGRARLVLPYADPGNGAFSWYIGDSTDPGAPGPRKASARIAAFLTRFVESHPVAGNPIVIGYSQGAIVAMSLVASEAPRIGHILSIAGRLPPALFAGLAHSAPGPIVDEFHGELDVAVPYAAARASVHALNVAGYAARLHTYAGVGHEIAVDEAADVLGALSDAVRSESASGLRDE